MTFKTIFFSFLLLVSISCRQENKAPKQKKASNDKENLARANKFLVTKDNERITSYIERRNWELSLNESGLWLEIYDVKNNKKPQDGQQVSLKYKLSLLDGRNCYDSEVDGLLNFRIGHNELPQGLNESVLLMGKGDKARLIVPPFLAYGLLGDQNKIPARAIIVYEIELIDFY